MAMHCVEGNICVDTGSISLIICEFINAARAAHLAPCDMKREKSYMCGYQMKALGENKI